MTRPLRPLARFAAVVALVAVAGCTRFYRVDPRDEPEGDPTCGTRGPLDRSDCKPRDPRRPRQPGRSPADSAGKFDTTAVASAAAR